MKVFHGYRIEAAVAVHIPFLNGIERAAATLFPADSIPDFVLSDSVPETVLAEAMRENALWVALDGGSVPVGYGFVQFIDGVALLAQLDVHPDHGRKGLGTALVVKLAEVACQRGATALYLTTFTHAPWNAPFYARLGFVALAETEQPFILRDILSEERNRGLSDRVAMRLSLPLSMSLEEFPSLGRIG